MIAGLTAVGKTTHSRILARQIGYRVISATDLVLHAADVSPGSRDHPWFQHLDEIEERRDANGAIDDAVDSALRSAAERHERVVFDTWALPWLSQAPAFRIKLVSTPEAAAKKVYVSQGLDRRMNLDECLLHMHDKNELSRNRFRKRNGIDLGDDEPFDLVVDNSSLIAAPTFASARSGIRTLKPLLSKFVRCVISDDRAGFEEITEHLGDGERPMVKRVRWPGPFATSTYS